MEWEKLNNNMNKSDGHILKKNLLKHGNSGSKKSIFEICKK